MGSAVTPEAAREVVGRTRGTPRAAVRILALDRGVAEVSSEHDAVAHAGEGRSGRRKARRWAATTDRAPIAPGRRRN